MKAGFKNLLTVGFVLIVGVVFGQVELKKVSGTNVHNHISTIHIKKIQGKPIQAIYPSKIRAQAKRKIHEKFTRPEMIRNREIK